MIPLRIKRLPHGEGLPLPFYATEGSAGADVCAALEAPLLLRPGERALVPTGFCYHIPENFEMQVRSRSGLSLKDGIVVLNSPGTIDSDYRGELKVILYNTGEGVFTVEKGMRIAQVVVAPVVQAFFDVVDDIGLSTRDAGGFGSTGF